MTFPDGISRSSVENAIDEWMIGKCHAERNRAILRRRLFDGICYEPLAEEFDLSVPQIKRIISDGKKRIFRNK